MRRRDFVTALGVAATAAQAQTGSPAGPWNTGHLKQCAMRVNFDPKMPFEEMCREAARLGMHGFDLIPVTDWPTLRKYGLIPTMGPTGGVTFENGMIHKELHDALEKSVGATLDQCAAAGCPNMITVGGQRKGMSYEEGAENCAAFLNRVKSHAEEKGVTICMEIMNNRFTQPELGRVDQICNHVAWGVDVVKRVNSPRVKLLFDIYHVQVMDGDICHHIQENLQWIAHFHTGGVPGRHEIDDTQEINYRFVAKTIADLGFTGYIAHEYRPAAGHDPLKSLAQAIEIMRV
jgi:hydroxypyruvate isomerase